MPQVKPAARTIAVRLDSDEIIALDKMVSAGFAANTSEAIRLAIKVAPLGLSQKVEADLNALASQTRALATQLEKLGWCDVKIAIDEAGGVTGSKNRSTPIDITVAPSASRPK